MVHLSCLMYLLRRRQRLSQATGVGAMYSLALFACRLLLSGLFLIAGASKLLGGFANSRKALAEFGVPAFLVTPFSIALPALELAIACLLLPSSSAFLG